MQPGDILSYMDLCHEEQFNLQKGMNFRTQNGYSIFLMSVRPNAPYADRVEDNGKTLIYEGHDCPNYKGLSKNPKELDQPQFMPNGKTLTENGKFLQAVEDYKAGKPAEIVKIYEKIKSGIWAYNGFFKLIDAWQEPSNGRNVFKFKLIMTDEQANDLTTQVLDHSRLIPTPVKQEVWKRDKGACVMCGSRLNLHFDHIIPFSKGGSSNTAKNIQLLCAKCNLSKHDKIM
ncbi:HNH endonuclease [Candidatus Avelusimicrobium faecicola]|uniref:HNH endonuclease n=1 Tax=Candidatus Avelusimicrobium faecicola TaxID=3416205 RepID=UPI003D0F974D